MSWRTVKLKHLCTDAGQYGLNVSSNHYTESGTRLIRTSDISETGELRPSGNGVFVDLPLDPRHILAPGDLLISRSGTLGRSLLVSNLKESATFAGYLVRFRPSSAVVPQYLAYYALSQPFRDVIRAEAVSSTITNFNAERYANIELQVPNIEEQRRIVRFLDGELAVLGKLSELRGRQVCVIDEREQAELKFLFESHISKKRVKLKHLLAVHPRYGVLVPEFVDEGVPFIRISALDGLCDGGHDLPRISYEQSVQYGRTVVRQGDLLLSVVGTLGRSTLVPSSLVGANIARAVALLRVKNNVSSRLLRAWLRTCEFLGQAKLATGSDTAQATLGMEDLANFELWWPEDVAAQKELEARASSILAQVTKIKRTVARQQVVLAEKRQALITAAVTGQIDVSTAREIEA